MTHSGVKLAFRNLEGILFGTDGALSDLGFAHVTPLLAVC